MNNRKKKLTELGVETLADALLELAEYSDEAGELIGRLIATPKENIQRFKKKLSGLKKSRRFIDWRGAAGFVRELKMLLQDVRSSVDDPMNGAELVAAFYQADEAIFEMCDDSNGNIGDLFCFDAKDLFVEYASRCTQKEKIAELVLSLSCKDDYGVRDALIKCVEAYLPEELIRSMIISFQELADKEKDEYGKRHYLMLVESLARQVKDAELFEQTRTASWGQLNAAAYIDIAEVYLDCGDVDKAYSKLKEIPADDNYMAYQRDRLLQEIYRQQGDLEKLTELLYQQFRNGHSIDTLQALLECIGQDQRDVVLDKEIPLILQSKSLRLGDAIFLLAIDKIDEAEAYLLKRADQLDGNNYGTLPDLAETMALENRPLVASLIYRKLLTSILERGYSKAYSHAVRYLKKLDKLAESISDWHGFEQHDAFKECLLEGHGRKRSFWSKYTEKK